MASGLLTMLMGAANGDVYPWALSSALDQVRLWDPSRALRQDLDALEKLKHDPVVGHSVYFRKLLASGTAWYLEPGGKEKADRAAASLVQSWLNQLCGFTLMRFNLSEAIFAGSRWARVYVDEREIVTTLGRGKWVVPVAAKDVDKRRLRQLRVEREPGSTSRTWVDRSGNVVTQEIPKQNVEWPWQIWEAQQKRWTDAAAYDEDGGLWIQHVVDDTESSLGMGNGLADDLVTYAWAKGQLLQYVLGWSERWGQGGFVVAKIASLIAGTVNGQNYAGRRDQILSELKKMRSENLFGLPKDDEVTVLEPNASNVSFVLELMRYLDSCMTRRVLFADLPTGGGAGGAGSLARAKEEGDSTEVAMLHDRALLDESITRDLVLGLWDLNYDRLPEDLKGASPPRFSLRTKKKKDSSKRVQDVVALLKANIPLKKEEVYEEIEFSNPTAEDEVFTAEDLPEIQAMMKGAEAQAEGGPDGQKPGAKGPNGKPKKSGAEDEPGDERDGEAKEAEAMIEREREFQGAGK